VAVRSCTDGGKRPLAVAVHSRVALQVEVNPGADDGSGARKMAKGDK